MRGNNDHGPFRERLPEVATAEIGVCASPSSTRPGTPRGASRAAPPGSPTPTSSSSGTATSPGTPLRRRASGCSTPARPPTAVGSRTARSSRRWRRTASCATSSSTPCRGGREARPPRRPRSRCWPARSAGTGWRSRRTAGRCAAPPGTPSTGRGRATCRCCPGVTGRRRGLRGDGRRPGRLPRRRSLRGRHRGGGGRGWARTAAAADAARPGRGHRPPPRRRARPAARGGGRRPGLLAVRRPPRRAGAPRAAAVVADTWARLPVRDGVLDRVLVVFAPRNGPEIARVLRPEGRLVVVTPAADHLGEIVGPLGLLRVDPDKAARLATSLEPHLQPVGTASLRTELALDRAAVATLVGMGPHARHRGAPGAGGGAVRPRRAGPGHRLRGRRHLPPGLDPGAHQPCGRRRRGAARDRGAAARDRRPPARPSSRAEDLGRAPSKLRP